VQVRWSWQGGRGRCDGCSSKLASPQLGHRCCCAGCASRAAAPCPRSSVPAGMRRPRPGGLRCAPSLRGGGGGGGHSLKAQLMRSAYVHTHPCAPQPHPQAQPPRSATPPPSSRPNIQPTNPPDSSSRPSLLVSNTRKSRSTSSLDMGRPRTACCTMAPNSRRDTGCPLDARAFTPLTMSSRSSRWKMSRSLGRKRGGRGGAASQCSRTCHDTGGKHAMLWARGGGGKRRLWALPLPCRAAARPHPPWSPT
jgi:hypothetical protein